MRKNLLLATLLLAASALCAQSFVSTNPSKRSVLIEEYTGVGCQYCPLGHKATDFTLRSFPGRAHAINIHTGVFATQYGTPWGSALASQAGVTGYPSSSMNRHVFENGGIHIDPGMAFPCALKVLDMSTPVNVAATVEIDPATRLMVVNVEVYYLGNGPGSFNLVNVALVQNNVLGPQTAGSTYYPENMVNGQYRHMHILRHLLTGQWGDTIHHTEAGSLFTKEYAYVVPNTIGDLNIPNLDDLSVLVFVCQDRKEVLNVCEAVRKADKAYIAYGDGGSDECSTLFRPYVEVVNPTGSAISALRLEVDGRETVCHKTLGPYSKDTIQLLAYNMDATPEQQRHNSESCTVRLKGYTSGGSAVEAAGEAVTINYADADIYTAAGPLTLTIGYDSYPQEVSFTLAGIDDCRFYYDQRGEMSDAGQTVSYTLSPRNAGLYRLKIFDIGADGLNGTVSLVDAEGNTLFSRSGRDLLAWDNIYLNITTDGTDGPQGTVVGIDDNGRTAAAQRVGLWPNPATSRLHVATSSPLLRAEVMDMTGRVLLTATTADIDLGTLPQGLYILRAATADGISTQKFIKQ